MANDGEGIIGRDEGAAEDAAFLASVLGGKNDVETARDEIAALCSKFVRLAQQMLQTPPENKAARERLLSACFFASDEVHRAQREWMLKGVDVFVAHDRNGSPIRVDRVCRKPIIGFSL